MALFTWFSITAHGLLMTSYTYDIMLQVRFGCGFEADTSFR